MAKRPLWMIAVLLVGAAAALWGATEVGWLREGATTGADAEGVLDAEPGSPDLTTLALLSLAGLAGVFAVGGWARRVLGALLVLAAGSVAVQAITADVPGGVDLLTGRGLALLGAAALAGGGVLVVVFADGLPLLGARYQAANARTRSGDPDKDMWEGLSDGRDPTTTNAEDER